MTENIWFWVLMIAIAMVAFLYGRWRGIKDFDDQYMPALDDARKRTQWLVDNWPLEREDHGITFPDGLFWPESRKDE